MRASDLARPRRTSEARLWCDSLANGTGCNLHGNDHLSVRRDGAVALGGDGQVTLGNVVVKATARKVRRLYHDRVLADFAGATGRLHAVRTLRGETRKAPRPSGAFGGGTGEGLAFGSGFAAPGGDARRRRLSASLVITGTGDVLEPEFGIVAIGSGGTFAQAAARALLEHSAMSAAEIVKQALVIAGDLCIYTNQHHVIEVLTAPAAAVANCERFDVVIAGAGLVGLALALALARAGLTVALVDRAPIAAPEFDPATGIRARTRSAQERDLPARMGAWQMFLPTG